MSSKLIRQTSPLIEVPGDQVVIDLKVWKSGKVQLQAPLMPPQDVCKFLSNISIDVMFAALGAKVEGPTSIVTPSEEANGKTETN